MARHERHPFFARPAQVRDVSRLRGGHGRQSRSDRRRASASVVQFAAFHEHMPRHWPDAKDRANVVDFQAKLWAAGQLASTHAAVSPSLATAPASGMSLAGVRGTRLPGVSPRFEGAERPTAGGQGIGGGTVWDRACRSPSARCRW